MLPLSDKASTMPNEYEYLCMATVGLEKHPIVLLLPRNPFGARGVWTILCLHSPGILLLPALHRPSLPSPDAPTWLCLTLADNGEHLSCSPPAATQIPLPYEKRA